jgi:hypothetical protein
VTSFLLNAPVTGIPQCHSFVILNLFQDNMRPWFVILKQVQDDERLGEGVGSTAISGDDDPATRIPEGEGLCGTYSYSHRRPSAGWGLSRLSA